ncbi:MAG: hypothetical protein ACKOSS_05970 [Planctomycetia bacterium]
MRILPLVAVLASALALAGCSAAQASSSSQLPAPASGTAWRLVGAEGSQELQGTLPAGTRVLGIDPSGTIRAVLPASPETQQAQPLLAPGTFGALQVRSAP